MKDVRDVLKVLEVVNGVRRMLLCMLKNVEHRLCLLESVQRLYELRRIFSRPEVSAY